MPLSAQEHAILDQVSLDEAWPLIEHFSTRRREHPRDVNAAMAHLATRLAHHGIPFTMHRPSLYLSLPGKAQVMCNGVSFCAKPPAFAKAVPQGFSAPLAHVPAKRTDGIDNVFDMKLERGRDYSHLAGKIVVTEGFASPGHVSQFEAVGAAGLIAVNPGEAIHWGICTTIWGTPGLQDLARKPGIPAVAVNRAAGEALIAAATAGQAATISAELDEGWFDSDLPVVEIKGTVEPDKFVLLHGHLDSWDVGVGDNAVGNAAMLEIARLLWANGASLRRSVRIAWWPGHSTGRYAGSTWFADRFAIDLDENCVAQINCDSPGCRFASDFFDLACMPEASAFLARVIGDIAPDAAVEPARPSRAGDYSFDNIGLTGFLMLSSTMPAAKQRELGYYDVGGCGGNIAWHTENDTIAVADPAILDRDIRIYLLSVWRAGQCDILPFDWTQTVSEFIRDIERYQAKALGRFDLSPAHKAATQLLARLRDLYRRIDQQAIAAEAANAAMLALARFLVPINFTREARFLHDPALSIPPLPTIAAAADLGTARDEDVRFLITDLTRGQNRLVAALHGAAAAVEWHMSGAQRLQAAQ